MQRNCFLLAALLLAVFSGYAQLCSGSLGDPVVKLDFGTGTSSHGPALGSSITSYTYSSADFPNDGSYTIEKTTNTPNTWWTTTDHTGNGGYMMVVNASTSVTDYFYKNTVTGLCPNTTYEFSAWIMNLLKSQDNSTPNITFTIEKTDGTILESYNTGNIPLASSALWKQFGFYFQTPDGIDTVVIRMRNNKVGAMPGNDIALDDIAFAPCGPTVTSQISDNSSTSAQVCEGQTVNYTLSGEIVTTGVYTNPAYQWQVSTDNGTTWTDISAATTTTYTISLSTAGVYMYRLSTAETSNIASPACRVASNLITITISDAPDAPVATSNPTECGNPTGSITITSPTGATYSIDGVNYQSSATFSALAEGDYPVTAKNTTTGCVSAATTVHVSVGSGIPDAPAATTAAPATCADANGTITITSTEAFYSFDNGATWTTANVAAVPPGDYQLKVKNAQGCSSDATTVTVPEATGFPPLPTVNVTQPDCITTTGTITVTDSEAAYSFDNGAIWQTTATKSNLAAATYTILTKNTLGCLSDPLEVTINAYVNNEPLPTADAAQTFCIYNNATLADVAITGTNIQWYAAATGGTALAASTLLADGTTYYASQTVTLCESLRIPVAVTVLNVAAPTGDAAQQFCTTQNPTVALLEATGTAIQWYSTATGGTALTSYTSLTDGATYYATQTLSGCDSQTRFAVTVSIVSPSIPVSNASDIVCDESNDGTETVDLTAYQTQLTTDTSSVFLYYTSAQGAAQKIATQQITSPEAYALLSGTHTLYVRIESSDKCYQVVTLTLQLVDIPVITVDDTVTLCQNSTVTVDAGTGFDTYTWSTGEATQSITIDEAGTYTVTVTQNHGSTVCTSVKDFTVILSNPAIITGFELTDWTDENNVIEIYATGLGDYEYSIDGVNWQDSNTFTGLVPGRYRAYVRDKNGCGTVSDTVYLLNYPKYFTPNGDSYNETWRIEFGTLEAGLVTEIFDRYGKLITVLQYTESWDGTYNGRRMPATDYWFVVKRTDGTVHKGHFSLMR
ncbi:T9SS type B sorting domain-containing protein [Flavobacterium sp. RHBU_3]|uniref:T9SS type B sorting domain-containing protein n=1 Tax=Flavobacterium sp. RHBU_3 TaxID=3391184 RepID=UPI003984BD26